MNTQTHSLLNSSAQCVCMYSIHTFWFWEFSSCYTLLCCVASFNFFYLFLSFSFSLSLPLFLIHKHQLSFWKCHLWLITLAIFYFQQFYTRTQQKRQRREQYWKFQVNWKKNWQKIHENRRGNRRNRHISMEVFFSAEIQ